MGCLVSKQGSMGGQQSEQQLLPCYGTDYRTIDQVTESLSRAGVISLNLIVGIDFTKSNEWTGKHSFRGQNLHHTDGSQNPYENAISIIARTLVRFNDNPIPCYGFGDVTTEDQDVFSFYSDDRPCNDHNELIHRYKKLVHHVKLAGPTSFAPIIEMAMTIVERSGGQYHVLLIIADGQVTRSIDTDANKLSMQEQRTADALEAASKLPMSILLVGVGDGPWDKMKHLGEPFRNFQFVNFTEIMSQNLPLSRKEAAFASRALMGIPSQCVMITGIGNLWRQTGRSPNKVALPPPVISYPSSPVFSEPTAPPYSYFDSGASSSESSFNAEQFLCPICCVNQKNMAFGCGHQTCVDCSYNLEACPICRRPIQSRLKLY